MYQLVLTTCPNEEVAKDIAHNLVNDKLAACVNIVANVTSIYNWQGKVHTDNEVQLLIKTHEEKFALLNKRINTLHPYDVVEIIALNIQQGDERYLAWIANALK